MMGNTVSARRRFSTGWIALLVWAVLGVALVCDAADWSRWRGPNSNGIVDGDRVFSVDQLALEIVWKRRLGSSYAGISISGDKAVTMYADGESDLLTALDVGSGREVWRFVMGSMTVGFDGSHDGPLSTPVIEDGVVYALGAEGRLVAVDLSDGGLHWSVDLDDSAGAKKPHYGFSTTPVVVGDLVVVQTGGPGGHSLTAVDRKDGSIRWSMGDGDVDYQSPTPALLAGRAQVIVTTRKKTMGVDPVDGSLLWSVEFESNGYGTPVVVPDNRFLLVGRDESALYSIAQDGNGYAIKRIWSTRRFKSTLATPVFHNDYLYGFDGRFLTCVDAANGEKVWKSRPPGGRGLIVVDGHLVVYGAKGDLVVAKATPEGYRERARINVTDHDGYTWPSFSNGRIFVRNLEDIACVRPTRGTGEAAPPPAPTNAFELFVREVERSDRKGLLLDDFLRAQTQWPIVENDRVVHFIYRGPAEDVAVRGSMLDWREELALKRIEGTDFFHRSLPIEPGSRWFYQFNIDFDNIGPDPMNSRRSPTMPGKPAMSEVVTSEWSDPGFIFAYRGPTPGRVESFEFESEALDDTRTVSVYLPYGYDGGSRDYPLVVATEGEGWMAGGALANTLDHLCGSKIKPVVVVFVPQAKRRPWRELGGRDTDKFVAMLLEELLPEIERKYRVRREPAERIILGRSSGAVVSLLLGLTRSDVFGNAIVLSYARPDEPVRGAIDGALRDLSGKSARFFVGWNRYELKQSGSWDARSDSRDLLKSLRAAGCDVQGGESMDSFGWGSDRVRVVDGLIALIGA